ncbi:hypothetical protein EN802_13555 [bacterium M00.F.Ca.ET.159.01.1.1]|nr:hypothetical protein EN802_13555 [bacterium M00.F.Ca.ET.159.01.1.1]
MVDKKIEDLPALSSVTGTILIEVVDDDGNSRKVPLSDLKTFINTDPTVVPSSNPFRGALVKRTTSQAITTATETPVTWESAVYDSDSIWSAGSPTRLTVPSGVTKVRLKANVQWDISSVGFRYVAMKKNGADFDGRGASLIDSLASNYEWQNIGSAVVAVTAGDYFDLRVQHSKGSNLNLLPSATSGSQTWSDLLWFSMEVVEATP